MGFFDIFKPVPSITAGEVREYIENRDPDTYCLIDVRQPNEYVGGHLPGAKLIPLGALAFSVKEIKPDRTVIVYCRTGSRSCSAVSILSGAGFTDVLNMTGGIVTYRGNVASGGPDAGIVCFPENLGPGELAAMAWFLEDGTLGFFEGVREKCASCDEPGLLDELTRDKEAHKETLAALYTDLTGNQPGADFPRDVMELPAAGVMAGCIKTENALKWAVGKKPQDILELMMALEANSLDLYLRLGRAASGDEARTVFKKLADEQTASIKRVAGMYEKYVGK
jgi:rhodanese-related sulfurtransferase/rubrerythrin